MRRRIQGFTVMEVLIVMVVIGIIAAIAVPGLISSQRSSHERNASTSLKTFCVAEADFRNNDRDGNKINDYWTGDVKSLYTLTNCATVGNAGGTIDPPIRMIDISIAAADTDSAFLSAGGENLNISNFAVVSSKAGYWYSALTLDNSVSGTVEATYKADTGGDISMGSVHNMRKFGFLAYPETNTFGRYVYMVNEANAIFRAATTSTVKLSNSVPPGSDGFIATYQNWPDDNNLKSYWSKLD